MPDSEPPPPWNPTSQARNLNFQLFFGSCAFTIWSLGGVAEGGGRRAERDKERQREGKREVPPCFPFGLWAQMGPTGLGWERGRVLCLTHPLWDALSGERRTLPLLACLCVLPLHGLHSGRQPPGKTRRGSHWCRQSQRRSQPPCPRAAVPGHRQARKAGRWRTGVWMKRPRRARSPSRTTRLRRRRRPPLHPARPLALPRPHRSPHPSRCIPGTASPPRAAPRRRSALPREHPARPPSVSAVPGGSPEPRAREGQGLPREPPPGQVPCVLSGNQSKPVGR